MRRLLFTLVAGRACCGAATAQQANVNLDHDPQKDTQRLVPYSVGGHGGHDWATWRHLVHARFLPGLWRGQGPPSPAASAAASSASGGTR